MKKSLGSKAGLLPTPVGIIGSYNENGSVNMMNAAWVGIVASTPAAIGVSFQPMRKTYHNILERKAFTINLTDKQYVTEADFFGVVSGNAISDKLENLPFTSSKGEYVDAPILNEFAVNIECEFLQQVELGSHIQVIGLVKDIKVSTEFLDENGRIDFNKLKPILFNPFNSSYYETGEFLGKAFNIGLTLKK